MSFIVKDMLVQVHRSEFGGELYVFIHPSNHEYDRIVAELDGDSDVRTIEAGLFLKEAIVSVVKPYDYQPVLDVSSAEPAVLMEAAAEAAEGL